MQEPRSPFRAGRPAVILALALAAAGTMAGASAATFYVDGANPACSNGNPGTEALPYCTISAAAAEQAGPGTTLVVKAAVYREQVTVGVSGAPGAPFVFQASGAAILDGADDFSSPAQWVPHVGTVWLAAGVTWSPVQVFVDDARLASSTSDPSALPLQSFRYVSGQGLYVNLGADNPGTRQTFVGRRLNGFRVPGRAHVEVRDFIVRRTEDHGIYFLTGASQGVVEGNTVTRAGSAGVSLNGCSFMTAESNSVSHSNSHGIYLLNGTADSVVRGNQSFLNVRAAGTGATGIKVESSPRVLLEGNRTWQNQDSGIQITFSDDCASLSNRAWSNGDSGFDNLGGVGCLHAGDVAWGNVTDGFTFEGSCSSQTLLNSIATDNGLTNGRFNLVVDPTCLTGFVSDHNILWKSVPGAIIRYGGQPYTSLAAYSAATGQDAHSLQTDPKYVNPGAADFQLLPDSPAIDSGDSSPGTLADQDALGRVRVDDPNTVNTGAGAILYLDRGALEFYGSCNGGAGPDPELCDALDNDCDGAVDDGFDAGSPCSAGVGACASAGTRVCTPDGLSTTCDAVPGAPSAEVCDGLDNDCDGTADELVANACGGCGPLPADGTCNGLDDNCNGAIDEGCCASVSASLSQHQAAGRAFVVEEGCGTITEFSEDFESGSLSQWALLGTPTITTSPGEVIAGTGSLEIQGGDEVQREFDTSGWVGATLSYLRDSSLLEGGDNFAARYSIDGGVNWIVLESVTGPFGLTARSFPLPSSPTLRIAFRGNMNSPTVDNVFLDTLAVSRDCVQMTWYATGSGEFLGTDPSSMALLNERPVGSGIWREGDCPVCLASDLTCDGLDDDCNGVLDDGSAEACDGVDNDCDGSTDEGFGAGGACEGVGACGPGVYECAGLEQTRCSTDPGGSADGSAPETCDSLDNDCDGQADEGFVLGVPCSAGTGACQDDGVTVCSLDGASTVCDAVPGTPSEEACDGLDNDCDGVVDNPAAPAAVPSDLAITHAGGVTSISWGAVSGATAYDLVLGSLLALQATAGDFTISTGACVADDTPATSAQFNAHPAAGDGYYYLVRPLNCGGNGSYDSLSPSQVGLRDAEIAASLYCP